MLADVDLAQRQPADIVIAAQAPLHLPRRSLAQTKSCASERGASDSRASLAIWQAERRREGADKPRLDRARPPPGCGSGNKPALRRLYAERPTDAVLGPPVKPLNLL